MPFVAPFAGGGYITLVSRSASASTDRAGAIRNVAKNFTARSDFSNLVSSPAAMRLKPGLRPPPAADLLARRIGQGQTPAQKSSWPLPHAASPEGLTLPCTFGWWRARRLDRSSRPDANAPRRVQKEPLRPICEPGLAVDACGKLTT